MGDHSGEKSSTFNSGEDVYVSLGISGPSSLNGYMVEDELPGVDVGTISVNSGGCGRTNEAKTSNKISWTLTESATSCTIQYQFKMP